MKKPVSTAQQTELLRESLRAIPIRNSSARVYPGAVEGELRIEVDLRYKGWLMNALRKVLSLRTTKVYSLDKIGSGFYMSIDGKKNLEQLSDEFAAKEKLTFFEARALVGQYLQTLTKKGLVVAMMPSNPASSSIKKHH